MFSIAFSREYLNCLSITRRSAVLVPTSPSVWDVTFKIQSTWEERCHVTEERAFRCTSKSFNRVWIDPAASTSLLKFYLALCRKSVWITKTEWKMFSLFFWPAKCHALFKTLYVACGNNWCKHLSAIYTSPVPIDTYWSSSLTVSCKTSQRGEQRQGPGEK